MQTMVQAILLFEYKIHSHLTFLYVVWVTEKNFFFCYRNRLVKPKQQKWRSLEKSLYHIKKIKAEKANNRERKKNMKNIFHHPHSTYKNENDETMKI